MQSERRPERSVECHANPYNHLYTNGALPFIYKLRYTCNSICSGIYVCECVIGMIPRLVLAVAKYDFLHASVLLVFAVCIRRHGRR